jgi:hypothetical protein
MGMLDRYKKKGGFFQLLQLIETSPSKKQEQFLSLIAGESPVWEEAIRNKMISIDRVYSWESQYLVEVFSRLQPLTLATAIHGKTSEEVDKLLSCLPPISRRKITDMIAEANPSSAEKATCVMKILNEVRGFSSQGIIKFEKVDPDLHIPENIEEILGNTSGGSSVLNFEMPSSEPKSHGAHGSSAGEPAAASGGPNNQEIEFLKRKVNQLVSEVNAVKHENSVLKDKLSQIKKIA